MLALPVDAISAPAIDRLPTYARADLPQRDLMPSRRTGRIVLALPAGKTARLIPGTRQHRTDGTTLLTASFGADRLVATSDGNRIFGHLIAAGQLYVIDTAGDSSAVLDADRIEKPVVMSGAALNDAVVRSPISKGVTASQAASSPSVVDVALFVEPALEAQYGAQAVRTRAQSWIDFTNEAFRLNGLALSLRLVYLGPFEGTLPASANGDLFGTFERNTAAAATARRFGADLRHLLYGQEARPGIDSCGRGTLVGEVGITGFECGSHTFAHEIGHNFGAHHDRANVPTTERGQNAYNYGYVCGGRGTLMSYAGASSLDHYSSPLLNFNGQACGVAIGQPDAAFNAAVIDSNREQVMAWAQSPAPLGSVRFGTTQVTLDESGAGVPFTIVRDGDLTAEASVEVGMIDETGTEGEDVRPLLQRVVFAPGESVRTLMLEPLDDGAYDGAAETLRAVLRYPLRLTAAGDPLQIQIVGDNDPDRGRATFNGSACSVREDVGTLRLQVSRTGSDTQSLAVSYSAVNETALSEVDFFLAAGEVVFAPGEREKTIDIAIVNDAMFQGYEAYRYFKVRLSGVNLGADREYRVFIVNEDLQRGRAQFSAAAVSARQGSGSVALAIERIDGVEGDLRVSYSTTDGSARAGQDYVSRSGELVLANGAARTTIDIPLLESAAASRSFDVKLSGDALGSPTTSTVTIAATSAPVAGNSGGGGGGATTLPTLLALAVGLTALLRERVQCGSAGARRRGQRRLS